MPNRDDTRLRDGKARLRRGEPWHCVEASYRELVILFACSEAHSSTCKGEAG